jgi:hypothetical protein
VVGEEARTCGVGRPIEARNATSSATPGRLTDRPPPCSRNPSRSCLRPRAVVASRTLFPRFAALTLCGGSRSLAGSAPVLDSTPVKLIGPSPTPSRPVRAGTTEPRARTKRLSVSEEEAVRAWRITTPACTGILYEPGCRHGRYVYPMWAARVRWPHVPAGTVSPQQARDFMTLAFVWLRSQPPRAVDDRRGGPRS